MTHPTDDQIDAAIAKLKAIIEAAENSNHSGEARLMKAAAADQMFLALANISANAELTPDVSMNGTSDCYAVPLDDIDGCHAALKAANPFTDYQWPSRDHEPEPADPESIAAREHTAADRLTDAGRGHLVRR